MGLRDLFLPTKEKTEKPVGQVFKGRRVFRQTERGEELPTKTETSLGRVDKLKEIGGKIGRGGRMLSMAFREREKTAKPEQTLFASRKIGKGTKATKTKAFLKPQGPEAFVRNQRMQLQPLSLSLMGMPEGSRSIEMLNPSQEIRPAGESMLNPSRRKNELSL